MKPILIKEGIYALSALDWSLRNFHGYSTDYGVTYNAYLIIDEKITLIDTVKATFSNDLLSGISEIIDISSIDYLIANHVEMDHSGAIPDLLKANPNIKIITSSPQGIKGLTAHYDDNSYVGVKNGDTLNIGKRTIRFVTTPMIHWPDNMVCYLEDEKILFSNDSFGCHYATSNRFDYECNLDIALKELQKYYANIVMPYSLQVASTLKILQTLDIEIIAPSHGVIWNNALETVMNLYTKWSNNQDEEYGLVVFDSMWHSTEMMALSIVEGFLEKGIKVKLFDLKSNHISDIMSEILLARYLCVGSPTLNNNMLPTVSAFLTYLKGLAPKGRYAMAFGSYGWGGQSIGQVEEELVKAGYSIFIENVKVNYIPKKEKLADIKYNIINYFNNKQ